MRRRHFDTLSPICPVCRTGEDTSFPLRVAQVIREDREDIIEGVLHCTNANCLREYPVIDGIPLIVANIRQYVSDQLAGIFARHDLSDVLESMLSDCCGPGSAFDQTRQQLSSYTWDHYADRDPGEPVGELQPGAMLRSLMIGTQAAGTLLPGPIMDAGCSVGRGTFALAEQSDALVLGVDLNFAMLRVASRVLRQGNVRYPRRRVGLVYERREFPAHFKNAGRVDFWACDATALPFAADTFAFVASMNVLDCVRAPTELLTSFGRILKPGGKAVIACPYDWSATATALEAWLGGHSQRSPLAGSSEEILRTLLTPGAHPSSVNGLKLMAERENLPWHVRLHDRSAMNYKLHLVVAERIQSHEPLKG